MATPTELAPTTTAAAISDSHRHPLDPLNASELEQAISILLRNKYLGDRVRIASLNLIEPAKNLVEKYAPQSPLDRKALAVLLDRSKAAAYEAVVNIATG